MQGCIRGRNYQGAVEALCVMKEHIPAVVVYHAFERFSHGKNLDLVNKGFGPLRAMLLSLEQGLISEEYVKKYFESSDSLKNFMEKIVAFECELKALCKSSLAIPVTLKEEISKFIEPMSMILDHAALKFDMAMTETWINAIDTVNTNMEQIIKDGYSTKGYLSTWNPRSEHANE